MIRAATTIQSAYRSSLERRWFLKLRKVVKKLRLMCSGSSGAGVFEEMSRMMQIQSKTMSFFQRRKLLGNTLAAIRIQRFMRGYQTRRRLRRVAESCVRIQAAQRSLSARRRMAAEVLAAVRLQNFARTRQAIQRRERQSMAATRIQSVQRGRATRLHLKMLTAFAVKIQALWRGVQTRSQRAETDVVELSRDSLDWDPVLAPIQASLLGILACARSPTETPSDLEFMDAESRAPSIDLSPSLRDGDSAAGCDHFDSTQLEAAFPVHARLIKSGFASQGFGLRHPAWKGGVSERHPACGHHGFGSLHAGRDLLPFGS